MTFGDTLGDEGDGLDLRELEGLEGRLVDGAGRGKVDNNVGIGALLDSLGHRGEDGEESFLGSPVELLDVVSSEGVDHGGDRRDLTVAGKVEVEHTLDGTGLETVDDRAGGLVEGAVPGAARFGGRVDLVREVDDAVLRLLTLNGGEVGSLGLGRRGRDGSEGSVDSSLGSGEAGGDSRLLGDTETEGNDGRDVVVGSEADPRERILNELESSCVNVKSDGSHLDLYTESLSEETHGLETFLVVRSTTTNEDADLVELKSTLVLLEGRDDTLEGGSDVGEVGNTSTDEEELAFGVGGTAGDEVD